MKKSTWILKQMGWDIRGRIPDGVKKAVLIVAPHTSLWDFAIGRIAFWHLGYDIKLLIKKEAFFWPFGGLLKKLGGMPVNRQKNTRMVETVAQMFHENDELILVITPEGTRKRVEKWKMGFYHISRLAKVPIALGWMDYADKKGGIAKLLYPSGNIEKDMAEINGFYKGLRGKYPEKSTTIPLD
ncbi:MAG: glycerol acyltransferase [Chlorobi bacterium]|nr:glycerol acyltransferase [Chlorobiota bacterium]